MCFHRFIGVLNLLSVPLKGLERILIVIARRKSPAIYFFLLLLLLPFSLFHVDERGEEYRQTASTSPVSSSFSQLRVPPCFYSSDWPSFLLRTEMANITTYGRHCRKPYAIILFKHWQYIQIAVFVLCFTWQTCKRNFYT